MSDLEQKFIEALAELEHDQWMAWAQKILSEENLSLSRKKRWAMMMMPYSELPEEFKDHDRVWAKKVFELVRKHVDD